MAADQEIAGEMITDLATELSGLLTGKKTVVLGIGQPDHGDDGVGPLLAEKIGDRANLVSLVCDELPENHTAAVIEQKPQVVLLLDAVDFNGRPGQVVLLQAEDLGPVHCSAHHASLQPLMQYLAAATGAQIRLLGIQPEKTTAGTGLCASVQETVEMLQALLSRVTTDEEKP